MSFPIGGYFAEHNAVTWKRKRNNNEHKRKRQKFHDGINHFPVEPMQEHWTVAHGMPAKTLVELPSFEFPTPPLSPELTDIRPAQPALPAALPPISPDLNPQKSFSVFSPYRNARVAQPVKEPVQKVPPPLDLLSNIKAEDLFFCRWDIRCEFGNLFKFGYLFMCQRGGFLTLWIKKATEFLHLTITVPLERAPAGHFFLHGIDREDVLWTLKFKLSDTITFQGTLRSEKRNVYINAGKADYGERVEENFQKVMRETDKDKKVAKRIKSRNNLCTKIRKKRKRIFKKWGLPP